MTRTVLGAFIEQINRQSMTTAQATTALTRIRTINSFLQNEFVLHEPPFVVGSYAKNVMVAGERDIDIMVPFAPWGIGSYWSRYKDNSSNFLYLVRDALNDRYATTDVSSRQISATLDFSTIKVDVVPCFPKEGGGYIIPNGRGGWIGTNPRFHTLKINMQDVAQHSRLKPMVKLMKSWNNENGKHLRSFHIELIVESIWNNSSIPTWSDAMKETILCFPSWLKPAFYDPWNGTTRVDNYLSQSTRDMVIRMLEEDKDNAEKAEYYRINGWQSRAFAEWQKVFRGNFPAEIY